MRWWQRSNRGAGWWFVCAGGLAVVRALMDLADPTYWNPSSVFDYAAAVLTTVVWVATGIALFLWATSSSVRRIKVPLVIAGVGVATSGIGNFLEDVVDLDVGESLYSWGGIVGVAGIMATAAIALTVPGWVRWSALLLFVFVAGSTFPDTGGQYLMGIGMMGLGYALIRFGAGPAR